MVTKGKDGKDFEKALSAFASKEGPYQGIRRVRLVETLQKSVRVEIGKTKEGKPVKAYKGDSNHRYEIWRMPDGEFVHNVVTTFDAHRGNENRHPAAKRISLFHKGDTVRVEQSKFGAITATVAKFNGNGTIELVPHNEANASDRYRKNKEDLYIRLSAKTGVKAGLRRVLVDEIGRVRDPGPPKL